MLKEKNFFESFGVGVGTTVLEYIFDQDDYKDLRQCPMERRGFFLHIGISISICQFLCFSFFNLLLGQSGSSSLHVFLVFFLVQDHLALGLLLQALLDHLLPVPPRNQQ